MSLLSSPFRAKSINLILEYSILNKKNSLWLPVVFFFGLEGLLGQPKRLNLPFSWATMLASPLGCSTAALTTPQKVLPIWKLVELKTLDFSDCTRTGISILTSAADIFRWMLTDVWTLFLGLALQKRKRGMKTILATARPSETLAPLPVWFGHWTRVASQRPA